MWGAVTAQDADTAVQALTGNLNYTVNELKLGLLQGLSIFFGMVTFRYVGHELTLAQNGCLIWVNHRSKPKWAVDAGPVLNQCTIPYRAPFLSSFHPRWLHMEIWVIWESAGF